MRRTLTLLLATVLVAAAATACRAIESPHASLLPTSTTATTQAERTSTTRSGRTTSTTGTTTTERSTTTTPAPTPRPSFTQSARITTWYSDAAADNSVWVHFKAVDEDGATVAEVPGSDLMNLEKEADEAARTPARERLVDALRQALKADGWTETGVAGEWYEYRFGR